MSALVRVLEGDTDSLTQHLAERVDVCPLCGRYGDEEHLRQHECLLHLLNFVLCHVCLFGQDRESCVWVVCHVCVS